MLHGSSEPRGSRGDQIDLGQPIAAALPDGVPPGCVGFRVFKRPRRRVLCIALPARLPRRRVLRTALDAGGDTVTCSCVNRNYLAHRHISKWELLTIQFSFLFGSIVSLSGCYVLIFSPGSLLVKRDFVHNRRSYHQFLLLKPRGGLQAAVLPVTQLLDDEEKRKQMSEDYGFKQIGEQLPDNVTLKDIMDTLPKEVFEINDAKAWTSVLISVTSYVLGLFLISKAPWYFLPMAWAWTGTAVTGFFVIGHDCAHKSFSRNKLVEDIVGTLAFLLLIYPYEPWRFKHDRHHAKTNMLVEDTAWQPVWQKEIESPSFLRKAIIFGYGPIRPWMSIAHWLMWHFDLKKFRPNELPRVKISLACVFAFMTIGWPLIILKSGIAGWFTFWFMPWMVYHFWMSTFTMVHHTAPHIPFKTSEEWNAAQAQLNGTVHCSYPRWIEILCHDINVHVPHHISPRIPSYNLRAAHDSIKQNWGKYINEANWNWRLMKTILTACHVYDEKKNYVSFDELVHEESQPIRFLKKFMPDYA